MSDFTRRMLADGHGTSPDAPRIYDNSRVLQRRAHSLIPGGCHTYAKGDDQFPQLSPGFIARGKGAHVWDVDGNEFIEYGMGCRAVTLGHAFEPILAAVRSVLELGTNFSRPHPLELECAEKLLEMIPGAQMCKFAKDGSAVTSAAVKLARAKTGRTMIAICGDHPFFSTYDWFIGTTDIHAGIPASDREQSVLFRYNDPDSLAALFRRYSGQIAAVILEPAKYDDPQDNFLQHVQELCRRNGAIFILDEIITGFRWANGGAQSVYQIEPDLSTFGKAIANGFSVAALVGRRDLMEVGGLYHKERRVFLLSTTNGGETHALAAALATMNFYQENPVIERLHQLGEQLREGLTRLIREHQLDEYVQLYGRSCALVFGTKDADRKPSQYFRALLMQELIRQGVLGPSLIVSYSHTEADIAATIQAFAAALPVYRKALELGVEKYLVGPPTQVVYSDRNASDYQQAPNQ